LSDGTPQSVQLSTQGVLTKIGLNAARRSVAIIEQNQFARVCDARTGTAGPSFLLPSPSAAPPALSPDGHSLITGCSNGLATVWNLATGKATAEFCHEGEVTLVTWRPDGLAALSVSFDDLCYAQIWDAKSGASMSVPMHHRKRVQFATFSADGERVVTASTDKTARIWNAHTGHPLLEPLQHTDTVRSAAFSSDGQTLATACSDGTARVWSTRTGLEITPALRHGGWVRDVAFSPDNRRIVSASDDGTARVWDAANGRPLTPPLVLHGGVEEPSFSKDGRLVLANNGSIARVWDSWSGLPVTPPLNAFVKMLNVTFSPDAQYVSAVTGDGRIASWDIRPINWPFDDLAAASRLLSCREMDATGFPGPLEQVLERRATSVKPAHASSLERDKGSQNTETGARKARALLRQDWDRLRARLNSAVAQ
jgi:WD40 repeat protein